MGRGQNWTSADDTLLCEAWLHVSQSSITGADQKAGVFWDLIMEYINEKPGSTKGRTTRANQSRFGFIAAAVSKWVGVHSHQVQYAASGTNVDDIERAALQVFRSEDPGGKPFDFRQCWLILRKWPKWGTPTSASEEIAQQNASPHTPLHGPGTPAFEIKSTTGNGRPIGNKRAKENILAEKRLSKQLIAVHSVNVLANKRARILQQQVALGYFKVDINEVPIEMRDTFLKTRTQLMKELDEEVQVPMNTQPTNAQPPGVVNLQGESSSSDATGYTQQPQYPEGGDHDSTYQEQEYRVYEGVQENGGGSLPMQPGPSHVASRYVPMDDFDLRIGI